MSSYRINTNCVQAGYEPANGEPRVTPIVQSTTYRYTNGEEVGKLFDLEKDGFFYTRLANPTTDVAEKRIAALEGGVGALLTSSGQAASTLAILNICGAGDHIIASNAIYGGTFNLFAVTLPKIGIETTFVPTDITPEELETKFQDNTKAVFIESLTNPALEIPDIEMYAKAAHGHGVPLLVDNTFATPINCRPFEHGADIVVHSTSKYMDGHAVSLGGVIVDSGNFDWNNGRFPGLSEADPSYHGIVYTESFGKAAYITKARVQLMRDLGMTPSPNNAFLLSLGLETLHLRVERHCENARKVAEYLKAHDKIESVNFPGMEDNRFYPMAQKYMPNGTCGVISFIIKGGREAAMKFMDSLKLAAIVVHVADSKTGVLHPASTTHRQLTDEQLLEAGIEPGMVRFSVGIEDVRDIIDDLAQALEQIS